MLINLIFSRHWIGIIIAAYLGGWWRLRRPKDRPKIYEYKEYRTYIEAMCSYLLKADNDLSSFRDIALSFGFRSQNFLKMVIDGDRNLSLESCKKISEGFKHSKKESRFFEDLVAFEQAPTAELRAKHSFNIVNSKIHPDSDDLDPGKLKYLTEQHYITIREMVDVPGFTEDPQSIGRQLVPRLTKAQVEAAIKDLIAMEYLFRNGQGRLENSQKTLSTGSTDFWNQAQKAALAMLHKSMAQTAVANFDEFDVTQRNYSGVTAALSNEQYTKIVEILAKTCEELVEVVSDETQTAQSHDVYRINLQMFPLTQMKKNKGENNE